MTIATPALPETNAYREPQNRREHTCYLTEGMHCLHNHMRLAIVLLLK